MFNFAVYRKFVNLNNGRRVLLRPLLAEDEQRLFDLFHTAADDDTRFLKDEVKKPDTVARWIANMDYERVMPLVAYSDDRLVGDVALYRGVKTVRHIGEIRIFLHSDFRGVGLGSTSHCMHWAGLPSSCRLWCLAVQGFSAVGFQEGPHFCSETAPPGPALDPGRIPGGHVDDGRLSRRLRPLVALLRQCERGVFPRPATRTTGS